MKKAQIQGQVFIYILTLIIAGAVLLYGYNAIVSIKERAEQVELVNFKTKLKSDFETISSDYGSVKTKTYSIPSKVKEICFYQYVDIEVGYSGENININNHLIIDSITGGTGNNVFLVIGDTIDPMELATIKLSDGQILCIPISGNRFKLRLEGFGDKVLVERAS